MNARRMMISEYQIALKWWKQHHGMELNLDLVSSFGYIALNDDNEPILCMFYYPMLGTKVSLIGWVVADPATSKEERANAMDACMIQIRNCAEEMGYTYILAYTDKPTMKEAFLRSNFVSADDSVTQYVMKIGEEDGK